MQRRQTVTQARATLQMPPGTVISVKAVSAGGLEGWDWARVRVAGGSPSTTTQ
jgi:hypothetical protein